MNFRKYKYHFLIILAVLIITAIILFITLRVSPVWEPKTEEFIKNLHPKIRNRVRQFINSMYRKGIKLRITSGFRTFEEQDELYAQGRTKPGKIVTQSKGGESVHNYCLAFDVVDTEKGYNTDWNLIGKTGKEFGFEWGGDWISFIDRPHFQDKFGLSTSEMKNRYKQGEFIKI